MDLNQLSPGALDEAFRASEALEAPWSLPGVWRYGAQRQPVCNVDGWVITDDDIRRAVPPNAYQAGLQYHMDRRVRGFRVTADGAAINAEVLGTARSPYQQSVQLIRAPNGTLAAAGSCTCPVGFNCKHIAAVLFEYRQRAPATIASPVLRPWVPTTPLSGAIILGQSALPSPASHGGRGPPAL